MRASSRSLDGIVLMVILVSVPVDCWGTRPFDAFSLVSELADLGPRVPGSSSHAEAVELLSASMRSIGLLRVGTLPVEGDGSWKNLTGRLDGDIEEEVVLMAHIDTVEDSPGALDNGSGCATVLGAAAGLSGQSHHYSMRVILFDGEEFSAAGSGEWLSSLSEGERESIAAAVAVEMVGARASGKGVVHLLGGAGSLRPSLTPAWLVDAAIGAANAAGFPVAVMDRRWSWFAQLAVRCTHVRRISDGNRFQDYGVPTLLLSDASLTTAGAHYHTASDLSQTVEADRLGQWVRALEAIVRRLDRLEPGAATETEYLVLGGRLWSRRHLVWTGFLLWMALVWRGLPGRWRGATASERRLAGKRYMPAFAFRMAFLLSVFVAPTFSTLLLYPAAAIALLVPVKDAVTGRLLSLLGSLPALGFVLWLGVGQMAGWFTLDRAGLLPATLVALTLATLCAWLLDSGRGERDRPLDP